MFLHFLQFFNYHLISSNYPPQSLDIDFVKDIIYDLDSLYFCIYLVGKNVPSQDPRGDQDSNVIMKTRKEFTGCCLHVNAD